MENEDLLAKGLEILTYKYQRVFVHGFLISPVE